MKTKRNGKKNHTTRNGIPYTPGRNMFGEKAKTHFVVLKRETAFQQMMDCFCQFADSSVEFTFDTRCFIGHEEELDQILAKVKVFVALKIGMAHKSFFDYSDLHKGIA